MKVHRLPALALAVSSLLVMGWVLGAGACNAPENLVPNCFLPNVTEEAADGGPDPCHCNIAPPYADSSCPCTGTQLFGDTGLTGVQVFHDCMSLLPDAGDAAEGGPLPACNGQCVPLPPPDWTPVLLWSGAESEAGPCPDVAPALVFAGSAHDSSDTFAIGCSSTASGACPGLGEVCGPGPVYGGGFQLCIMQEGDHPCVSVGPQPAYPAWSIFYEGTPPQPIQPVTFCCSPASQEQ